MRDDGDTGAGAQAHDGGHLFLRVAATTDAGQDHPLLMNRAGLVHTGHTCSACAGANAGPAIVGTRFTCIQCQVDLCEACEASGAHDPAHPRLKYAVPTPGRGAAAP